MDHQRHRIWIDLSPKLGKIEQFMVPVIEGLGKIDSYLVLEDKKFSTLTQKETEALKIFSTLTDRFTLSYLWVLGVYELVRTLDRRYKGDNNIVTKIKKLKSKLARLRIPLAKMEAERKYKSTDFPIAYPLMRRQYGISWQISKDVVISRRELSDQLVDLLKEMPS